MEFNNVVSPNKERYPIAPNRIEQLRGLVFFSIKNKHSSFVIPSSKNYFDDFHIKVCKIDQGATRSFIPIMSLEMLDAIFRKYTPIEFIYNVEKFNSCGGGILTLTIKSIYGLEFDVRLGTDIFPHSESFEQKLDEAAEEKNANDSIRITSRHVVAKMKKLNFFLCTDDIEHIFDTNKLSFFEFQASKEQLGFFRQEGRTGRTILRRTNCLIGVNILKRNSLFGINLGKVELFFNPLIHDLKSLTWGDLIYIKDGILTMNYLGTDSSDADELNAAFPETMNPELDSLTYDSDYSDCDS
jgi:hypothetical protein